MRDIEPDDVKIFIEGEEVKPWKVDERQTIIELDYPMRLDFGLDLSVYFKQYIESLVEEGKIFSIKGTNYKIVEVDINERD
ncbi:MAG: hypothetical protein ACOC1O_04105 [bacterium]